MEKRETYSISQDNPAHTLCTELEKVRQEAADLAIKINDLKIKLAAEVAKSESAELAKLLLEWEGLTGKKKGLENKICIAVERCLPPGEKVESWYRVGQKKDGDIEWVVRTLGAHQDVDEHERDGLGTE